MLRRLGNKSKLASKIIQHFPKHTLYIEPFFGAGGLFFNKPKAQYNILNDLDDDVINLYDVILNQYDEFKYLLEITPYANSIFQRFRHNKETEPLRKALRFVYLSNYSLYGKMDVLRFDGGNHKMFSLDNLEFINCFLNDIDIKFTNSDFRRCLNQIFYRNSNNAFAYCDPPYQNTGNNYSHSFTEQDLRDLFEVLIAKGIKFAVSEFDNPVIDDIVKQYNLNKIYITERRSLKNRNTEILVTNYENTVNLFD